MRTGPAGDGDEDVVHVLPDDVAVGETELELVADIWSADARAARHAAERAVAVARLAQRRRREQDRVFGPRGGPGVDSRALADPALADFSETLVPELALIRNCSEREAEELAVQSLVLTRTLTGTWSALYEGRIDEPKMRVLVDLLRGVSQQTATEVERLVLPHAERLTVPDLRARVRRLLAKLEAAVLEARRAEAARLADARRYSIGDGMSQLVIDMATPIAAACADALDQYARMLRDDGDRRPLGVLRSVVAEDLILRPWEPRPAVTAQLTIHAPTNTLEPDGVEPAEVNGEVVSAAQCRELLEQLDMLGVRAAPAGGCVQVAVHDPRTRELIAVATRRELRRGASGSRARRRSGRRRVARPAPMAQAADRPSAAQPDRPPDGPGLRPPAPTAAYRPTAEQKRFVRVRDRRCRMPGCRRRPGRCDIDHGLAYDDGGPTDCWNLCCLCRRHHRIKTFAPGWSFTLLRDGRLIVRTPSGVSRVTWPPGWWSGTVSDPPEKEEEAPPDPARS
jgi:hypothetical protein